MAHGLHELPRIIIICLLVFGWLGGLWAQEIRPVRDDVGFCWDGAQMNSLMNYLKKNPGEEADVRVPSLIAGISPHDDYLYAGTIYYPLFKRIKAKEAVIFGVTHKAPREKIGDRQDKLIFDTYTSWRGPYKEVKVSRFREYLKEKLDKEAYIIDNEAHQLEHSIEALVPFLQHFNPDVQITPIMVTGMSFETMEKLSGELAAVIASYIEENHLEIGKDIVFLISADANHYGRDFNNIPYGEDDRAHQLGVERDQKMTQSFLSGEITPEKIKGLTGELWGKTFRDFKDTYWCGKYSIPFGMLTVLHLVEKLESGKRLKGKVLRFSDTYSGGVIPLKKAGFGITAPFSLKHWVSFFSSGYYLE